MAGLVTANLLVGRMFGPAAGIARLDRQNARSPLHQMFDAPKAASCENGRIGRGALFAGRPLEIERNGVDAMADILGRESLAGEHMAQMSSAFRADDLGPASVAGPLPRSRHRNWASRSPNRTCPQSGKAARRTAGSGRRPARCGRNTCRRRAARCPCRRSPFFLPV